ncbi:aspartyl/asparaginyl beta-hydroxylase domain-containing protein [Sphingomonas flavalba]|uniref:aspartyl/asparaginyl beta-hydroxylase domain-containing protein n=1 Tax=Sphingomonas flavalba TaxID=2559804 RepID=UPI001EF03123|nr:aspartyl/asparaginyl beta-hydroxylase domain-containing protein [Sphingomonas flavalba]
MSTNPRRPWLYRAVKKARPSLDRLIARYSEIPDTPVLNPADFPFTRMLRESWLMIRHEAETVLANPDGIPPLAAISPDHRRIAPIAEWQSFFLHGYGTPIAENLARCPKTARLIGAIPDLNSAFFSVLRPGAHIPPHRGVTKGLVTTHLGLVVPAGAGCRMRIGSEIVRWGHGETLTFDDTFEHEVWNDTPETRVVLLIQTRRRLRFPGTVVADALLWGIRRSPFVREGVANLSAWNAAHRTGDRTRG